MDIIEKTVREMCLAENIDPDFKSVEIGRFILEGQPYKS